MKKQSGFTLIELMVTLVVAGILYSVAGSSLQNTVAEKQLVASANDLLSALHIARSEAIKLNRRVTICESSDGASCDTTGNWEDGWIVFVDGAGAASGATGVCANATTDCLLRVHGAISGSGLTIRGLDQNTTTINSFTFTSRGLPKDINGNGQSGVFAVCVKDAGDNDFFRAVALSFSGRVRISDNTAVLSSNTNSNVIACP